MTFNTDSENVLPRITILSENDTSKDPHKPLKIERNLPECSLRTLQRGLRSTNVVKVVASLSRGLPNLQNIGFGPRASKTSEPPNKAQKVSPQALLWPSFFTLGHHNGVKEAKQMLPQKR